ncbi:laccase domain-containing protein, partial [Klebsiella pneumoniae]|uniref:laccase domain-containing protein n=1 Tax=Klebsiella pneumoniae TaxID=573 RepID=UPI0022465CE4
MEFVQGLPQGVYVGQTRVQQPLALPTELTELTGFNLALHVKDEAQRVQQQRMMLLDEFAQFGVKKMTWMTQTHSTICHT